MPENFYKLAIEKYEAEDYQGCIDALEEAVSLNPEYHEAYGKAGEILAEIGQLEYALNAYMQAIRIAPESRRYKQGFADVVTYLRFDEYNYDRKKTFLSCLEDERIDVETVGAAWFSLLKIDPHLDKFAAFSACENFEDFEKSLHDLLGFTDLNKPFLLFALRRIVVANLQFEKLLTYLRRALLNMHQSKSNLIEEDDFTRLSAALAHYTLAVDYIFHVEPEEESLVDELDTSSESAIAILACYKPLCRLQNAREIEEKHKDGPLKDLVRIQITDLLECFELRKEVPSLTEIDSNTSSAVREQYEEFPYPRSIKIVEDSYNEHESHTERELAGPCKKILNAGCGTGTEAIGLSLIFPEADILAVDLSLTSLAYSIQKTRRMGLDNITFKHADILKLKDHPERYDFISSVGVLHHMKDPMEGWKILTDLLKPGGIMRIALYSKLGRQAIATAWDVISEKGYESDAEGIRRFRADAPDILDDKTYTDILDFRDYFFLPECRDLLFHVQEHQFTLPQIKSCIEELGLEFAGFNFLRGQPDDYAEKFPDDPNALNLDYMAQYEEENPKEFSLMYRFFCRKP